MKTTKVFKSGNSQAVRLPKAYQFRGGEVEILKRGNEVIIREIPKNLAQAFTILSKLPEDFLSERGDAPPQKREDF